MSELSGETWEELSQAYAFLGNSLLKPMTQTSCVGLTSEFWQAFPDFGSAEVRDALDALACYADNVLADAAKALANEASDKLEPLGKGAACAEEPGKLEAFSKSKAAGEFDADIVAAAPLAVLDESAAQAVFNKAVEHAAVEYTHLFVGPPSPAAPPWETMNLHEGATVGFGEPTFQMRALLREAGLELSNENRQYEDHMGIELLYLSELCRRCSQVCSGKCEGQVDGELESVACAESSASGADASVTAPAANAASIARFIEEHPRVWIDAFAKRVSESYPDGYFAHLLACIRALLAWNLVAG